MDFRYHPDFERGYEKLHGLEKDLVKKAISQAMTHYETPTGTLSYGARLKRLGMSNQGSVYEIRAGMKLRVVFVEVKGEGLILFRLIAGHDEVRRFIRGFAR